MRLQKYTDGWTRRYFMEKVAKGVATAGVIAPLWDCIGETGTCEAAYPSELLSIDAYTKGKLKAGDVLSADNVDYVKDILDPIAYHQIKNDKRVVDLAPSTTDVNRLNPPEFLEATLKNRGVHRLDQNQNVWTKDGKPWIGGNPFPEPENGTQVVTAMSLSWGKHDSVLHPIKEWDTDAEGNVQYTYEMAFMEYQTVGRLVMDPKPYFPGHLNTLRLVPDVITAPADQQGTAFLQVWAYDQRQFPEFYGYTPLVKRVRTFPTDQRFEPLLPGNCYFSTLSWHVGDPVLTWGNFKIVGRGPILNGQHCPIYKNPGWLYKTCGGNSGKKYFRTWYELVPEAIIVDYEPVKYPRSPISKKRTWFDARTMQPLVTNTYDRQGKLWQQWEGGFAWYDKADGGVEWPTGAPDKFWWWTHVIPYDIQSNTCSRMQLTPEITGGYKIRINDPGIFEEYCSMSALRRLGR